MNHDPAEFNFIGGSLTLATLLGTMASLAMASLINANRDHIEQGLYGYNGALIGLTCATFFEPNWALGFIIIAGASCTSIMMHHWRWKIPPFTFPFLTTVAIIFCISLWFDLPLRNRVLADDAVLNVSVFQTQAIFQIQDTFPIDVISQYLLPALNGVGQILFQQGLLFSLLTLVGLYLYSVKVGTWAIFGASIGLLFNLLVGLLETNPAALSLSGYAAAQGLYGFNAALIAITLCQIKPYSAVMIVFAAILASTITWLSFLLDVTLLTLPFVLTAWVMIIGKKLIRLTRFNRRTHSAKPIIE